MRGATRSTSNKEANDIFQSTLPVRGATSIPGHSICCVVISIHAPRAGSDRTGYTSTMAAEIFQSSLPVRGATTSKMTMIATAIFQSTLPVRGATRIFNRFGGKKHISIHAPRAGSDTPGANAWIRSKSFQSTLPVRGATIPATAADRPPDFNPRSPCGERPLCGDHYILNLMISIHAPRAGSDRTATPPRAFAFYFNPRSPCGERPPRA